MVRQSTTLLFRQLSSVTSANNHPSLGFSGAGFLGCYHVGVAACLYKQGILPNPHSKSFFRAPLVTGVSAGSMIAAAVLAGVNPDPDGMEVVLEAARRTRKLARASQPKESGGLDFNISLDILTPGFSLIDQVEEPFRKAIVKALGGNVPEYEKAMIDQDMARSNVDLYDIDPELFKLRFPAGSLRIGLTDRRELWPPPIPSPIATERILAAYRYVDSFRDVDDIIAACMLSSYIPGVTGPFNIKDKVPDFLSGFFGGSLTKSKENADDARISPSSLNDTADRAGARLREMEREGLVKDGKTGLPIPHRARDEHAIIVNSTDFWDGGIADVFPTFDERTVIIAPVNGVFAPNPAICPIPPSNEHESNIVGMRDGVESHSANQHPFDKLSPVYFQSLLRSYVPTTFRHCNKARLGLNSKNAQAALKMMFSSKDEELYQIFMEGYDDARRYLDQSGQLRVFTNKDR